MEQQLRAAQRGKHAILALRARSQQLDVLSCRDPATPRRLSCRSHPASFACLSAYLLACLYLYLFMFIFTYFSIYIDICVYIYLCIYIYTYIHIYICIYIYTYIHIYIYTYIYICIFASRLHQDRAGLFPFSGAKRFLTSEHSG